MEMTFSMYVNFYALLYSINHRLNYINFAQIVLIFEQNKFYFASERTLNTVHLSNLFFNLYTAININKSTSLKRNYVVISN